MGQTNYDKDYVPPANKSQLGSINKDLGPDDNEMTPRAGKSNQDGGDINTALDNLKTMQKNDSTVTALRDVGEKISSQSSKLENLIFAADRAQASMSSQNKQMRSFLR